MKNKFLILIAFGTLLSCSKEETTNQNYRLKVDSKLEFFKLIKTLTNNTKTVSDVLQVENFYSLQDRLNSFNEKAFDKFDKGVPAEYERMFYVIGNGSEKFVEYHVTSTPLRKVLNGNGEIEIGDSVFVFTYNTVYSFETSSYDPSKKLDGQINSKMDIVRKIEKLETRGDVDQCDTGFPSGRKMSGETEITSFLYVEVGTRVKHRRKTWYGAWVYTDAKTLQLSGQASFSGSSANPFVVVDQPCWDFGTNQGEKQFIFHQEFGSTNSPFFTAYNIDYVVTDKSNVTRDCNLSL